MSCGQEHDGSPPSSPLAAGVGLAPGACGERSLALRGEIADAFNERRNGATRVWTGRELILWSGDQGGEGGPPTLEAVSFTPGER
jgi:hypothetical protein